MGLPEDMVSVGRGALSRADWSAARSHFEDALTRDAEDADAIDGLSEALWWQGEWARARELRERSFTRHRASGRAHDAARAAIWLANEYLVATGNRAAWNGWLERASGALESVAPCAEHGWLLVSRGRRAEDVQVSVRACEEALAVARQFGDVDLEVLTLSQLGRSLVAMGRVDEGFARLDEAMAAVTAGEPRSFFTVCDTCCNMLTTCEGASEMERLTQWCRVTDEVSKKLKGITLYSFCRLNYASVLIALGRWAEAEKELREALESAQYSYPTYAVHMLAKLAELRIAQGRIAEAEELLKGHEEAAVTARVMARLRIARGEGRAAVSLLTRRLAQVGADVMQAAPLHALLVEARLLDGDVAGAREAAIAFAAVAQATGRAACLAGAAMAMGNVALAEGDANAWATLEDARERFALLEMPLEAARARLSMARALAKEDADGARAMARGAREDFEKLGAMRDVDRAAEVMRELGVGGGPGRRVPDGGPLSAREAEVLALLVDGLSNVDIGKRLFISPKTAEHHVGKVLSKLGLKNRAAAAAHVLKQRARDGRTDRGPE